MLASVPEAQQTQHVTASYETAYSHYEAGQTELALSQARSLARTGHAKAQLLAGHILRSQNRSLGEAAGFYTQAANQGEDDAMLALGEMALSGQGGLMLSDAASWFTKAAKLGRTDAMRALGDIYIKGAGITANPAEGVGWIALAADQGDVLANRRMGDINLETHPKDALMYYERAAQLGDPESAYFAAIMYAENLAIRPNELKAAALMKQAALADHPAAMADYGLLIFQGLAGDGKVETAASWFEKAARAGDDQGKFLYAYSLSKGEGVPQNFEQAYYWLLKTNKSGIAEYDKDIDTLREALERQVDRAALERARQKLEAER